MPNELGILFAVAVGGVWAVSGRDPLYWLVQGLVALRAALVLWGRVSVRALREYRREYSDEIGRQRVDLLGVEEAPTMELERVYGDGR